MEQPVKDKAFNPQYSSDEDGTKNDQDRPAGDAKEDVVAQDGRTYAANERAPNYENNQERPTVTDEMPHRAVGGGGQQESAVNLNVDPQGVGAGINQENYDDHRQSNGQSTGQQSDGGDEEGGESQDEEPHPIESPNSKIGKYQDRNSDDERFNPNVGSQGETSAQARMMQAQVLIASQRQSGESKTQRERQMEAELQRMEDRMQALEQKLSEGDDLIGDMSKLIDVSRNKQLQRKLLKFNDNTLLDSGLDGDQANQDAYLIANSEQSAGGDYRDNRALDAQKLGGVSSGKNRNHSNVRIRDLKKKKGQANALSASAKSGSQFTGTPLGKDNAFDFRPTKPGTLAPLNRQAKKRSDSAQKRSKPEAPLAANIPKMDKFRQDSPIQEKIRKQKKKKGGLREERMDKMGGEAHYVMNNTHESTFAAQGQQQYGGQSLQNVEQFKNFLLENDSQFSEYLNSELLKKSFDAHMMKEGMITFMAQMMGNGSAKDNFFLKTRSALQDTMTLFFITKNIAFNNNIEFYLPRLVEMLSDLLEVERCSIFLYDGIKDQLYCKVITGRLREAISFERDRPNILSTVFNSGQSVHVKDCNLPQNREELGEYAQLDAKLHTVTKNVLIAPIKLGSNAIGCMEVANKKKAQDFTTNDINVLQSVCEQISNGLIAHEMKYNIKKESDEELRYIKGLMNQSLNSFLIPMISEINQLCVSILKSERVLFFMYNKDIDHLYSISSKTNQVIGQFGIDSIRMKSNLGLSGQAFTHGKIMIEKDINTEQQDQQSIMCQEEKDLKKLKIEKLRNAIAIPIFDKQTGSSVAVVQAYNFDEQNYLNSIDENILMSLSNIFSSTIFNVDNLQGVMTNSDLLQAQYDLVNDACIFINTQQMVTKINKSAEILFNTTSSVSVGQQVSEFLGVKNNHFLMLIHKLTFNPEEGEKNQDDNPDSGQIGGDTAKPLQGSQISQQLLGSYLISDMGRTSKVDAKEQRVPMNFYIHRLTNEHMKTFGFCLIFQPIIIMR